MQNHQSLHTQSMLLIMSASYFSNISVQLEIVTRCYSNKSKEILITDGVFKP